MVTNLNEYRDASTKSSVSYNSTRKSASSNVVTFTKECPKKAKARANLLRAAQKIRW